MNQKCKKTSFNSEKEAIFSLEKIKKVSTKKVIPTRAYECFCGKWHLTSRLDIKDIQRENEELKRKNEILEKKVQALSKKNNITKKLIYSLISINFDLKTKENIFKTLNSNNV